MDRNAMRQKQMRRDALRMRRLWALAAVILFCGLFAQIAVRAQISGENKKIAAVEREIHQMTANAENLNLNLNQYHNLAAIGQRAQQLGMEQPTADQLRVVNLPVDGNTSAQSVSNVDGEDAMG